MEFDAKYVFSFVNTSVVPFTAIIVANVAMKGAIFILLIRNPFIVPTIIPVSSGTATASIRL